MCTSTRETLKECVNILESRSIGINPITRDPEVWNWRVPVSSHLRPNRPSFFFISKKEVSHSAKMGDVIGCVTRDCLYDACLLSPCLEKEKMLTYTKIQFKILPLYLSLSIIYTVWLYLRAALTLFARGGEIWYSDNKFVHTYKGSHKKVDALLLPMAALLLLLRWIRDYMFFFFLNPCNPLAGGAKKDEKKGMQVEERPARLERRGELCHQTWLSGWRTRHPALWRPVRAGPPPRARCVWAWI